MSAVKGHFASHQAHLWACGVAALLIIAAIALSLPILAVVGVVICGAMMLAMVWMMVSMASKAHH